MNPLRLVFARLCRISAPALMLLPLSSAFAGNKNYVLLSSVSTQDFASTGPGVDQTATVTNNYDNHGHLLDTLVANSGTFNQVQTITYTNDNHGVPLTSTNAVNNDGAADPDGPNDVELTAISTFTYDNHGNRTAIDQEVYNDNDEFTIVRHTSLTNDSQGRPVLVETVSDVADINGVFDGVPDQVITVENTWDNQGHLLQSVTTADIDGDGLQASPGDSVETRVNTLNSQGEVTTSVATAERIIGGGVVIHTTSTSTYTYNSRGLPTQILVTFDNNNDGVIDQTNTITNTWVKK